MELGIALASDEQNELHHSGARGMNLSSFRSFIVSILYAPLSLMLFPKDLIEKQLNNKKELRLAHYHSLL